MKTLLKIVVTDKDGKVVSTTEDKNMEKKT